MQALGKFVAANHVASPGGASSLRQALRRAQLAYAPPTKFFAAFISHVFKSVLPELKALTVSINNAAIRVIRHLIRESENDWWITDVCVCNCYNS